MAREEHTIAGLEAKRERVPRIVIQEKLRGLSAIRATMVFRAPFKGAAGKTVDRNRPATVQRQAVWCMRGA